MQPPATSSRLRARGTSLEQPLPLPLENPLVAWYISFITPFSTCRIFWICRPRLGTLTSGGTFPYTVSDESW
jgi:hypothetical protein